MDLISALLEAADGATAAWLRANLPAVQGAIGGVAGSAPKPDRAERQKWSDLIVIAAHAMTKAGYPPKTRTQITDRLKAAYQAEQAGAPAPEGGGEIFQNPGFYDLFSEMLEPLERKGIMEYFLYDDAARRDRVGDAFAVLSFDNREPQRIGYTNAPRSYDFSADTATLESFDLPDPFQPDGSIRQWRKVALYGSPDHQIMRYQSGGNAFWDDDPRVYHAEQEAKRAGWAVLRERHNDMEAITRKLRDLRENRPALKGAPLPIAEWIRAMDAVIAFAGSLLPGLPEEKATWDFRDAINRAERDLEPAREALPVAEAKAMEEANIGADIVHKYAGKLLLGTIPDSTRRYAPDLPVYHLGRVVGGGVGSGGDRWIGLETLDAEGERSVPAREVNGYGWKVIPGLHATHPAEVLALLTGGMRPGDVFTLGRYRFALAKRQQGEAPANVVDGRRMFGPLPVTVIPGYRHPGGYNSTLGGLFWSPEGSRLVLAAIEASGGRAIRELSAADWPTLEGRPIAQPGAQPRGGKGSVTDQKEQIEALARRLAHAVIQQEGIATRAAPRLKLSGAQGKGYTLHAEVSGRELFHLSSGYEGLAGLRRSLEYEAANRGISLTATAAGEEAPEPAASEAAPKPKRASKPRKAKPAGGDPRGPLHGTAAPVRRPSIAKGGTDARIGDFWAWLQAYHDDASATADFWAEITDDFGVFQRANVTDRHIPGVFRAIRDAIIEGQGAPGLEENAASWFALQNPAIGPGAWEAARVVAAEIQKAKRYGEEVMLRLIVHAASKKGGPLDEAAHWIEQVQTFGQAHRLDDAELWLKEAAETLAIADEDGPLEGAANAESGEAVEQALGDLPGQVDIPRDFPAALIDEVAVTRLRAALANSGPAREYIYLCERFAEVSGRPCSWLPSYERAPGLF